MNITSRRIAALLILALTTLMSVGCSSLAAATPVFTPTPGLVIHSQAIAAPLPDVIESPNPAYVNAQATKDTGQSQLLDLSRKSTDVSLNMAQAANAAAQATRDSNQRQKLDLSYQATVVSLNIAQAAATQNYLLEQTKLANDATTAVQSSAATATESAFMVEVTQTAQAQVILDSQAQQTDQAAAALTAYPITATYLAQAGYVTATAQAMAILNVQSTQDAQARTTQTAYPMTATPFAVTKAALLMQQYGREQTSFVDLIVRPMVPFIASLDLLLFVLVIIFAYRRFMLRPRYLSAARVTINPIITIDATVTDHNPQLHRINPLELMPSNPSGLPGENTVRVEVINAIEPPIVHWIAEVEHQLDNEGGLAL